VTAATCSGCHPATVRSDGTIDLAGGKHVNGQVDVASGHPAGWSDPTVHGYQANASGLQSCTGCHVGFGAVSGLAGSSCNGCHSAGTAAWQSNCTFCHGTVGRTGTVAGTDARLDAAPPVGSQGQTARSQAAVGAHQAHVNPPATTVMALPVACAVCHPGPLPTDTAHVAGQPTPVQFSGLAVNWGFVPTYSRGANPTCSSTYCHGAGLVGGTNTTPSWTGGPMGCTSCHGIPPASGSHGAHPGGNQCNLCHPNVTADGSALTVRTVHANGIVNLLHGDGTWACDTCH
jgi:predicted CxxxxCH...CXXCH cytochrome family protein